MSKCLKTPFEITDENYSDIRKNNLRTLINRYQTLTTRLIELENSPNKNQESDTINNLNSQIISLQRNIFDNNSTSITRIKQQKDDIVRKNNSANLNKDIIQKQNEIIDNNDSIIGLANTQYKDSKNKNDNIDKKFTIIITISFLIFLGTVIVLILHKESINPNLSVYDIASSNSA